MTPYQDSELTAYCGLFCGDCIRFRSRASALASQICDEFARTQFREYARAKQKSLKELENFDTMVSVLKAIEPLHCTVPCRSGDGGCSGPCRIALCVRKKNLDGCWECADFETCENFRFLESFHGNTPQKNLRLIKKYGIDAWAAHREKMYTWL